MIGTTLRFSLRTSLLLAIAAAPSRGQAAAAGPIDFATVPRAIAKLPKLEAKEPLYGLFLFGPKGETRVWAVLDKSRADAPAYDVLHLDLNANGDLTDEGECFKGKVGKAGDELQS